MADVQATNATGAPLVVAGPVDAMILAADTNCLNDLTNEPAEDWWLIPSREFGASTATPLPAWSPAAALRPAAPARLPSPSPEYAPGSRRQTS